LTFAYAIKAISTLPDDGDSAQQIENSEMTESEIEAKYYPAEEKGLMRI